ncbi:uncharacterized protein LODBEIA_P32950 [Lodderomyces beijingensis]|uniref:F-box domain-containing protein n=1 Tax=Lodderomyces beijingensis TaxID=1775926 RepID=A0ABP0ZLP5_9ASCO
MLELPDEVIERISYSLHQDDIVSLMLTNSRFHRILQSRLYSVIVVDSLPKLFQLEEISYNFNTFKLDSHFVKGVIIRSVYALKNFFKNATFRHVKKFIVYKLPDIPHLEMLQYMESVSRMNQLEVFEWWHDCAGCAFPASLLKYNSRLCEINGYIDSNEELDLAYLKSGVFTKPGKLDTSMTKVSLRNMELKSLDISQVTDLLIENCTYKKNYLLDQNLNLNHLTLHVEDDPALLPFLSKLRLKSLNLKTQSNVDRLLGNLDPGITSLVLQAKLQVHSLKQLSRFVHLTYFKLEIIEKDLFELLPFIPTEVQVVSFQVVEPTERNNCLIAEEYWQCPRANRVDQNRLKYQDFVLEYRRKLKNLAWVMFNGNDKNYVFECTEDEPVVYRDGFECYFPKIVNTFI